MVKPRPRPTIPPAIAYPANGKGELFCGCAEGATNTAKMYKKLQETYDTLFFLSMNKGYWSSKYKVLYGFILCSVDSLCFVVVWASVCVCVLSRNQGKGLNLLLYGSLSQRLQGTLVRVWGGRKKFCPWCGFGYVYKWELNPCWMFWMNTDCREFCYFFFFIYIYIHDICTYVDRHYT